MSQTTAIEWTDLSWNPVHGCSIVSTECRNCYAATLSLRYGQTTKPWTPANAAENVTLKPHKLREPLSNAKVWRGLGAAAAAAGKTDGKLVFVNSMSDLFHEEIPDEYIARVFAVMALAPRHTFQVLTKRPERMHDLLKTWRFCKLTINAIFDTAREAGIANPHIPADVVGESFASLDNVWLGVSIGKRHFNARADLLRETPAAVRFISAEPLLGPLVRSQYAAREEALDRINGLPPLPDWELDLTGIDWLIAGGESGSGHRPMRLEWVRDLRDACAASGTAVFVKQLGGARPGTRLEDLPDDLRLRDFPRQAVRA